MTSHRALALLAPLATLALAVGCGGESSPPSADAPPGGVDAPSAIDAGFDAAPPAMLEGIAGQTCAAGCQALGKTCVTACTTHRSCGGHDGVAPPYAGYACYFWENDDGTFRINDGRSFTSCDEVVTQTWDNFGTIEELGTELGDNPVSCCCQ
jgi:hypothetical protein